MPVSAGSALEQLRERLQPASRGTDPDDRKTSHRGPARQDQLRLSPKVLWRFRKLIVVVVIQVHSGLFSCYTRKPRRKVETISSSISVRAVTNTGR